MADFESIADKATGYVFGELPPDERAEFEAMLGQSPELRAHVRELEEGALAIAAAVPNGAPPKSAWREINRTIAHDQNRKRGRNIAVAIFKNGWAAAAACIVGWLIFALSTDRSPSSSTKNISGASRPPSETGASTTNTSIINSRNEIAISPTLTNRTSPEAIHRETTNLQNQLAGLQQQIAQLSNALTQHQAALNEPSRLKFFQLAPSTGVEKPILSPAVQQAFFYALAQELGWLSFTNNEGNPNFQFAPSDPGATNAVNMDFVDLRTNANSAPVRLRVPASKELAQNTDTTSTHDPLAGISGSKSTVIPAFVSGSSLFFAVDSSMAPADTQVFVAASLGVGQSQEVIGSAVIGDAPVVFAVRAWNSVGLFNSVSGESIPLTVTLLTRTGTSNVVFGVFAPALNP
jgi:hypothetical protein